jgi:hypothetical protein
VSFFIVGGIKYKKSTIRNQSIIQKYFYSPVDLQRGKMKKKNVLKTSQLNNGGFGYI